MSGMIEKWKGIIISESLEEPRLVNDFEVYKVRISREDLDLGEGRRGRWHMYWVNATEEQIEKLKGTIRKGWYAHFWRGEKIIAIFRDRRFDFSSNDRSTWEGPVEYGKSLGILEEQLDFPTE